MPARAAFTAAAGHLTDCVPNPTSAGVKPTLILAARFSTQTVLVAVLVAYHLWCGRLIVEFRQDRNIHDHVWYRWFNEIPTVILIAAVILVVVKPF